MRKDERGRGRDRAAVARRAQQAQLRRAAETGRGVHDLSGDVGPALDEVVHGVGDEEIAVGVERRPQLGERLLSAPASSASGNGSAASAASPSQTRRPACSVRTGKVASQRLDVVDAAHDALDLAADHLGQDGAVPHLVGDAARPRAPDAR